MTRENYAGIDYFRFIAAFMVIAIHTAPFSVVDKEIDFLLTYCLGRVAVPFFLMTTGYFVLSPYVFSGFERKSPLHKYLVKNTGLYLAATFLYLPLMIYSNRLPHTIPELVKAFFFDGTFYHLWYFPAAVIGCNILMILTEKSMKAAVLFCAAAYTVGLFGDTYYGVVKDAPLIGAFYEEIFQISSYTRNGLFFAPVFILLGMLLANKSFRCSKQNAYLGFFLSLFFMFAEGFVTFRMDLQKHNSMYFFLLPVMYFLFQLLLSAPGKAPGWLRNGSMLLYIIHPAVIALLRAIAKAIKQTPLLVENTLVHYLCVCLLSACIVLCIHLIAERRTFYVSKRKSLD